MLLLKLMVVLLLLRSAHLGAAAACSRVCAAGDGSMMGFPSRESAANAQRAWLTSHVAAVSMIADETRRRDVPLIASRRRPIYHMLYTIYTYVEVPIQSIIPYDEFVIASM
jgi:hypothetical protein